MNFNDEYDDSDYEDEKRNYAASMFSIFDNVCILKGRYFFVGIIEGITNSTVYGTVINYVGPHRVVGFADDLSNRSAKFILDVDLNRAIIYKQNEQTGNNYYRIVFLNVRYELFSRPSTQIYAAPAASRTIRQWKSKSKSKLPKSKSKLPKSKSKLPKSKSKPKSKLPKSKSKSKPKSKLPKSKSK